MPGGKHVLGQSRDRHIRGTVRGGATALSETPRAGPTQ